MQTDLNFLDQKEYFIPIRVPILLERIRQDSRLSLEEKDRFQILTEMISNRFHFEYYNDLRELKNAFVPFDPDRETLWEPDFSETQKEEFRSSLMRKLRSLLDASNFSRLSREQLNRCLQLQPYGGLSVRVDTSDFLDFDVYYRGVRIGERSVPKWKFWEKKKLETRVLKRVFVVARYRNDKGGNVIVKLFKDVPVENIKIVAPKVRLGLPIFDRVKIGGTVCGGLATSIYKLFVAAALSWVLFLMILSGFVLAAVKGIFGFLNSKTKYMQIYSSSLYFQNLSNNNGALTSLIYMTEEQEIKEALLAYFLLYAERDREFSLEELDLAVENWLKREFDVDADFEIEDALRKLVEKDVLIQKRFQTPQGKTREIFKVFDLPETLARLDQAWDEFYRFNSRPSRQN